MPYDDNNRGCGHPAAGSLERVRFFPRQLLTADDLRAEQEYSREKQRRHNRLLHGWGVVCGLEVVLDPQAGPLAVRICPGYALGPFGDEIFVPEAAQLDLTYCARPSGDPCNPEYPVPPPTGTPILVMIRYAECRTRPMRTLPAGCGCDETACEYSRIRDGFEIRCMPKPEGKQPEADGGPSICKMETEGTQPGCLACPTDPWVVLATIPQVSEQSGGSVTLGSPDNTTRRIVHSTAAIQRQLIVSCCNTT